MENNKIRRFDSEFVEYTPNVSCNPRELKLHSVYVQAYSKDIIAMRVTYTDLREDTHYMTDRVDHVYNFETSKLELCLRDTYSQVVHDELFRRNSPLYKLLYVS